jgi:hypothetical protein
VQGAQDVKGTGEAVLPTRHQCQILGRQLSRIFSDELFTQGIIGPEGIAQLEGHFCGDRFYSRGRRKGRDEVQLRIDRVQQGKPQAIEACGFLGW